MNLRNIRQKIHTTKSMSKIFKAMELISSSRINKSLLRLISSIPYADAITKFVSEVSFKSDIVHPLTSRLITKSNSIVLVLSSNRGLTGNYTTNIINKVEKLASSLKKKKRKIIYFLVGRKIVNYFSFKNYSFKKQWSSLSTEVPTFLLAKKISDLFLNNFFLNIKHKTINEIHIIYTRYYSRNIQKVEILRLLPLKIVEKKIYFAQDRPPQYEFDSKPSEILDYLLNRYIEHRIFNSMLHSAMSEIASRQKAMKIASDNSHDLEIKLKQQANSVRQNEITKEILDIINGASASE